MKVYAKINLLLRIVGKRKDGYHNLQMINSKINLYDDIYIEKIKGEKDIITNHPNSKYKLYEDNLIIKVVKKIKEVYNIKRNYNIIVNKQIPIGAGLGGLSMDASSVVKYILKDNDIYVNNEELIKQLLPFGADIPYGLIDSPSIVEGIGEIITPIKLKEQEYILINPNIYVSTPEIFKLNDIIKKELTHEELLNGVLLKQNYNDLEIAVLKKYPEILNLKKQLEKLGYPTMSGSGSTYILSPSKDIDETLSKLKEIYPNYLIIKIKTIGE